MTAFKPATPAIAPAPEAPAVQPHVPHYPREAVRRIVTSRTAIGVPSPGAPPHIIDRTAKPIPQVKKEYAWQKRRALGKRF